MHTQLELFHSNSASIHSLKDEYRSNQMRQPMLYYVVYRNPGTLLDD